MNSVCCFLSTVESLTGQNLSYSDKGGRFHALSHRGPYSEVRVSGRRDIVFLHSAGLNSHSTQQQASLALTKLEAACLVMVPQGGKPRLS